MEYNQIENISRQETRKIQEDKLLEIIPYVYKNSPLQREVWKKTGIKPVDIRSIDDFQEKVPFINKDMVKEYRDRTGDPAGGLLCVPHDRVRHTYKSSGTTGTPTNVFMTESDSDMITTSYFRHFSNLGVQPGMKLLFPNLIWHWGVFEVVKMCSKMNLSLLPLDVFDVPNMVNYLGSYRPDFMFILVPPFVGPLRDMMARQNLDPREVWESVKFVIWTGEGITKAVRSSIEDEWGVKVYQMAGYSDVFNMTFECPQVDGTHSSGDDMYFAEVIDPDTLQVREEGQRGEHVCTSLSLEAMPVLRYRTGDLGYIKTGVCGCGRSSTRSYWLGRKDDVVTVNGKSIFAIELKEILDTVPGVNHGVFQMVKYADDMNSLRIIIGEKEENVQGLRENVLTELNKVFDVPCEIESVPFEEMQKLAVGAKMPRIRDVRG